ncbi:hypothetical protein M0R45_014789 [Rubus argutus]|uniref:Protein kinase domain-containing protein n=1 Tax=Rubus argutus TaxID=59490 RepID=A0AAW1XNT1_RUBAR
MVVETLQFLLLLLFLLIHSATPLTFNFSTFPTGTSNISLEGDAYIDGFLRLTKSAVDVQQNQSVGRATYRQPFLLRQNATGKLADFTTNFTFVIDSLGKSFYADGLAFFIAPNGSLLNSTIGIGGSLGLPVVNPPDSVSSYQYPFVAVEFDIFRNQGTSIQDPASDHVGIDVDSVKSLITKPWNGSLVNGAINSASVSYDSGSKNLSVAYSSYVNGVQVMTYLDYTVDLNQYLPDWVIVGFSAATGSLTAVHKINSWSFDSTSLVDESKVPPEPSGQSPSVKPKSGNGNVGLVVGLVVGGSVIMVGGLGWVWFVFCKKRGAGESDDDNDEDPMVYDSIDDEFEKGTGPRKFAYSVLARATSNFQEGEKLGEGGFGGVYRGFIKELDSYVAVKRVSRGSKQGLKEYAAEVRIISRLRHRNLVQLIALEIACGRKPMDVKFGRSRVNMVEWVWELYGEGKVIEAADPRLSGDFDKNQMECLLIVGLWCAHPDSKIRPSIQQAIQVLNFEVPLPILPSKMPVASYFAAPVSFSILSGDTNDLQRDQTESSGYNTNASQFTTSSASNSSPSASLLYTQ